MPIHTCTLPGGGKGYQWGGKGKCYANRKDAERQAEAAYSNGYAGDADVFALDKSSSRTKDADGRMHVGLTNISKANVCPYYGREIPEYQALGLQADKVYYLYRHPDELAKAARTFNKVQLLEEHQPVHAGDPKQTITVGALGESAVFEHPYLKNTLAVWDARAISGIETEEKKQLSSSYRYRADMTPGVSPEGVHYDGVMRDIVGNHVALVTVGRAGADVAVGDSQTVELTTMKKQGTKRLALRVAVGAFLRPALAADAAIPLDKLIAQDGSARKTAANVKKMYGGKFDIDATALTNILKLASDEAEKEEAAEDEEEEEEEEEESAEDEEEEEEEHRERGSDRKRGKDSRRGKDEHEERGEDRRRGKDAKRAGDRKRGKDVGPKGPEERESGKPPRVEDKKAHDAALVEQGKTQALKGFRAIREAEELVRPLIGAVAAMDSAEEILRFALDERGVEHEDVDSVAGLTALVKNELKHADSRAPRASHAQDSATAAGDFQKRFPNAVRPGRM